MSTVLIIGASRGIGLATVSAALKAGRSVRALSRSASAIRVHDPNLEKLDGDALDRDTIERALAGVLVTAPAGCRRSSTTATASWRACKPAGCVCSPTAVHDLVRPFSSHP